MPVRDVPCACAPCFASHPARRRYASPLAPCSTAVGTPASPLFDLSLPRAFERPPSRNPHSLPEATSLFPVPRFFPPTEKSARPGRTQSAVLLRLSLPPPPASRPPAWECLRRHIRVIDPPAARNVPTASCSSRPRSLIPSVPPSALQAAPTRRHLQNSRCVIAIVLHLCAPPGAPPRTTHAAGCTPSTRVSRSRVSSLFCRAILLPCHTQNNPRPNQNSPPPFRPPSPDPHSVFSVLLSLLNVPAFTRVSRLSQDKQDYRYAVPKKTVLKSHHPQFCSRKIHVSAPNLPAMLPSWACLSALRRHRYACSR